MNQLAPELVVMILNNLSVQDKLKCRLINNRFKLIIDNHLKIIRLTLIGVRSTDFDKNWFYTNRPNDEKDLIFVKRDSLADQLNKSIFLKLKQLFISFNENEKLNFKNSINHLKYLEELNICSANIGTGNSLNLPNLRTLFLGMVKVENFSEKDFLKIKLNTPNLSNFKSSKNIDNYEFVYPTKIRYLYLNYDYSSVEQFINLEYLFCSNYFYLKPAILLDKLSKLKELHIFKETKQDQLNGLNIFETIFKERSKLNLNLYVSGLDYRIYRKLNQPLIDQSVFCFENYSNLINCLPFIKEISYDDLIRLFKQTIPTDLFTKFPNIKEVTCNFKLNDLDGLFNFLRNCKNLGSLSLNCESFNDQLDFEKLNESCRTLIFLSLTFHKSVYINLDFILKFKYLNGLVLNKELAFDFIESLFTKLNRFRFLHFKYRGKIGDLTFDRDGTEFVHLCQNFNFLEFKCLTDFLNFLK